MYHTKCHPTLEVFSVGSAKSFMPMNYLAKLEKGVRKRAGNKILILKIKPINLKTCLVLAQQAT